MGKYKTMCPSTMWKTYFLHNDGKLEEFFPPKVRERLSNLPSMEQYDIACKYYGGVRFWIPQEAQKKLRSEDDDNEDIYCTDEP